MQNEADEESNYDNSYFGENKRWRKVGGKYTLSRRGPLSSLSSGKTVAP